MLDYREMPLGPLAPDRIGDVITCPNCGERGLHIDDYVNPMSRGTEKEPICLHFIEPVPHIKIENNRTFVSIEFVEHKCAIPNLKQ